jgi:hypothetical protein
MHGRSFATFVVATLLVSCGGSSGNGGGRDASTGNGTGGASSNGGAPSTGGASNGGSSANAGGSSGKGSGGAGTAGSGGSAGASGCATDPLHTGETPPNGDDEFDCAILAATEKYGEPDAMIFKAIIHTESRFAVDATACPNLPCGTPAGWTQAESYCYGLMQIVPACVGPNKTGLLPNGHPNLTTDATSPDYATSIFNPSINIDIGVYGVSDNRKQEKQKFAGCTEDQYTLMAIGDYNSYGSTKSCTVFNAAYDDEVLKTYATYAQEAGWPAHPY